MADASDFPEIYLVGAPKCGSRAMYENLTDHPGVWKSEHDIPAFFATDLPRARVIDDRHKYLDLYRGRGDTLAIDSSTTYFYSEAAIDEILAARPDAKIIILLRNPADMVFSLHNQQRVSLHEPHEDFATAWADSDRRWAGPAKDMHEVPQLVCYQEAGQLAKYSAKIAQRTPEGQLAFFLLEDFAKDFEATYCRLLDFLGLEHDGKTEWRVVNRAQTRKYPFLSWLFLSSYGPLGPVKRLLKKVFGFHDTAVMKKLQSATVKPAADRKRLEGDLRKQVLAHYEDDIGALEKMLGRSLAHWRS